MKTPSDALSDRVHELLRSSQQNPILSTTGTRAAIDSLAARVEKLEAALDAVATVVAELAESERSAVR